MSGTSRPISIRIRSKCSLTPSWSRRWRRAIHPPRSSSSGSAISPATRTPRQGGRCSTARWGCAIPGARCRALGGDCIAGLRRDSAANPPRDSVRHSIRSGASAQQVWEFSLRVPQRATGMVVVTMIKTFMDETGLHGDAEMVAVGGYISRPKHWRAWTKDWNAHKRGVPPGRRPIDVFHSTDCANYHGEFEGWTKEERDPYVAQLLPIIPSHELA